MHKLHSHRFKHTIISKVLIDMHLLMLHLLEEILRKHCMHLWKSKRQSTLNLLKVWQISKILLQNSHLLSVYKRKVSFHLNHNKIPRGNTMWMQVVLEANTWIKPNQSSLFAMVRLLPWMRDNIYKYYHYSNKITNVIMLTIYNLIGTSFVCGFQLNNKSLYYTCLKYH